MSGCVVYRAPIFFISSSGSSATTWLAQEITKHPRIECLHSPNGRFTNSHQLIQFLSNEAQASGRIVGAIHMTSAHGTVMRSPIISAGGKFIGLLRHPIHRVSSQFTAKQKLPASIHRYTNITHDLHRLFGILMAALEQIKGGALNDIELEFTRVAVTIISSDMQLMTRADKNELFRFEDFTTDLNTFSQLLKTIVNGVFEIEETFLNSAFLSQGINKHHSGNVGSPEEVFSGWSHMLKQIYIASLLYCSQGNSVFDEYESFGYTPLSDRSSNVFGEAKDALTKAVARPNLNSISEV